MRFNKDDLPQIASGLLSIAKNTSRDGAVVLALSGDLGAGKTTLVQEIARKLGVAQIPSSPTFVIMRSYETTDAAFKKLVHIDAYRIEAEDELRPLHLTQVFSEANTLVCIEWSEKLGNGLPKGAIHITLISQGENERELQAPQYVERALQKVLKMV